MLSGGRILGIGGRCGGEVGGLGLVGEERGCVG